MCGRRTREGVWLQQKGEGAGALAAVSKGATGLQLWAEASSKGLSAMLARGSFWKPGGSQEIMPSSWPGSEQVEEQNDICRPL